MKEKSNIINDNKSNEKQSKPNDAKPIIKEEVVADKKVETKEESFATASVANQRVKATTNKFDRVFIKIWSSILSFIDFSANLINRVIKFIFKRPAPAKYVKTFVAIILVIFSMLLITAPFKINVNKAKTFDVFGDNLIPVSYIQDGETLYGYQNKKGERKLISVKVDEKSYRLQNAQPFTDGVAFVKLKTTDPSPWRLINTSGKLVVQTQFEDVGAFRRNTLGNDNWMPAKVKTSGTWTFIDKRGKPISDRYDEVSSFKEGFARVRSGQIEWFINTSGKAISQSTFEEVRSFSSGIAAVKGLGGWGYINTKGKVIIDPNKNAVSKFYGNGKQALAVVRYGSAINIIDVQNKSLLGDDGVHEFLAISQEFNEFVPGNPFNPKKADEFAVDGYGEFAGERDIYGQIEK